MRRIGRIASSAGGKMASTQGSRYDSIDSDENDDDDDDFSCW